MRPLPSATLVHRVTGLAAIGAASISLSCGQSVEGSTLLSFLEALQRPFDLHDVTVLGIPAELPAHLLLSALLAAAVAWWWRPLAAALLIGSLIVIKEALDLGIVALYEPVTWAYAEDSVLDVAVSMAGAVIGLLAVHWVRRRREAGSGGDATV